MGDMPSTTLSTAALSVLSVETLLFPSFNAGVFFCKLLYNPYTVTMMVTIHSPRELSSVASEIIRRAEHGEHNRAFICALSGDLGAGKTTLTQEIARQLGVVEHVNSPTFVIRKRYETTHPTLRNLIHIDAYRLHSGSELRALKFDDDSALPNTLLCIEWPEQIADLGIQFDCTVQLRHADAETREITIT